MFRFLMLVLLSFSSYISVQAGCLWVYSSSPQLFEMIRRDLAPISAEIAKKDVPATTKFQMLFDAYSEIRLKYLYKLHEEIGQSSLLWRSTAGQISGLRIHTRVYHSYENLPVQNVTLPPELDEGLIGFILKVRQLEMAILRKTSYDWPVDEIEEEELLTLAEGAFVLSAPPGVIEDVKRAVATADMSAPARDFVNACILGEEARCSTTQVYADLSFRNRNISKLRLRVGMKAGNFYSRFYPYESYMTGALNTLRRPRSWPAVGKQIGSNVLEMGASLFGSLREAGEIAWGMLLLTWESERGRLYKKDNVKDNNSDPNKPGSISESNR